MSMIKYRAKWLDMRMMGLISCLILLFSCNRDKAVCYHNNTLGDIKLGNEIRIKLNTLTEMGNDTLIEFSGSLVERVEDSFDNDYTHWVFKDDSGELHLLTQLQISDKKSYFSSSDAYTPYEGFTSVKMIEDSLTEWHYDYRYHGERKGFSMLRYEEIKLDLIYELVNCE